MQLGGLLIGLGNPGKEYVNTRHNLGFIFVDYILAEAINQQVRVEKLASKKHYELWKIHFSTPAGHAPWLVLKPLSYMNNSGIPTREVADYYNVDTETIVVAHDEMDIPFGEMRFKFAGGAAGHKGILSIAQHLNSQNFYRIRLGIGKSRNHAATIGHVLGSFSKNDEPAIKAMLVCAGNGFELFRMDNFKEAQQVINGFKLPENNNA